MEINTVPAQTAPALVPATTLVFDIADLFSLLSRGRKIIFLTVAATTLAALAFGVLTPKKYTTEAQLFVDSRGYQVLPNEVAQRNNGNQSLMADFETELQILGSGSVLSRVVQNEKLASNGYFMRRPGYTTRLKALLFGAAIPDEPAEVTAIKTLSRMVSIKRSDRSFVAGVQITTPNAQLSARLAQAVATSYLEIQLRNRSDLTRRLATEVAGRLQDLRERVEAAEKRLATYNRKYNLVSTNGSLVSDQDLSELNRQLNEARTRAARAKAQLDQIKLLPRGLGANPQSQGILNSPTVVQLNVRMADASRQLAELRRNLGPRHPDIRAAEARVGEMRNLIAAELQRQRKAIEVEYAHTRAHENAFEKRIADLKSKSTDISDTLIGARELQRAVEANKKVYEEFLVRARELTEQQSIAPSSSRIITSATPPTAPSNIPLPYLLIAGLLAGLPIGVGLAYLRDLLDRKPAVRVVSPDGQPNVAANQPATRTTAGFHLSLNVNDIDAFIEKSYLRRVSAPPAKLLDATTDFVAAAGMPESAVFLVTGQSSATSTCAIALAAALSYQGHDTLLADCDSKQATLSHMLNLQLHPGLFDRFHREVEQLVLWNRAGLPHILASLPPAKRSLPQGAHRYLAHRLEELTENVEFLILDAGRLDGNPFSSELIEAATHIVVADVSDTDANKTVNWLSERKLGVTSMIELTGTVSNTAQAHSADDDSSNSADAPVVGPDTDGKNNSNKKRWYLARKRIVG